MKKTLAVLFLVCSGGTNAKVVSIDTLQASYEIYATLNTCHQFGYIDDDVLETLDDIIQGNQYQDHLGNISNLNQNSINYYHSLRDRTVLGLQEDSNMPDQSGYRFNIKMLCDQLNSAMGSKLGVETIVIPSENLPDSAKPIANGEEKSGGQATQEDKPMKWENSPVGGVNISSNSDRFNLDNPPDGLESLDTPGLYIKSSVDSDGLYQINGLYELYKPKPAPGTDEILDHPFYGCGDMLQEIVEVIDVTSGDNRNTVSDFKVRHEDGTNSTIPFVIWTNAMNQLQKNSTFSLIAQGKRLRIYYQTCGSSGGETIRGVEKV
ncbi:hypothetical protein [Aeromonas veronii]